MTAKPPTAVFVGYRLVPSRKVATLMFELPLEALDATVRALGGTPSPDGSTWVALVPLTNEAAAVEASPPPPAAATPIQTHLDQSEHAKPTPHPLVKRAGVLAKDPGFWIWSGCSTEATAAAFIRTQCQVASRRDLATDEDAAERFRAMDVGFRVETRYSPHLTGRK